MRWFYEASGREPVFIFAIKIFQRLVGYQEIAVCLASALFSVLIVWATYLLGSYAFSHWVGLGAAFSMAIERDVISEGVLGFRDEAFVFFVLLSAYGVLRSRDRASRENLVLCGLAMGGACLTRITSVTLVLPAIGYLALLGAGSEWKLRVKSAAIVALIVAAVVSPFLVNCWITFGDPLFSLHDRTRSFQQWFDLPTGTPMSPGQFLLSKAAAAPVGFAETAFNGFTTYPFHYKWNGFEAWLALIGMVLFLWSFPGHLLLLVLLSSMVPYVFTWQTPRILELHHFRYTLQAYPIYLIAAALAIEQATLLVRAARLKWMVSDRRPPRRLLLKIASVPVVIVLALDPIPWTVSLRRLSHPSFERRRAHPTG
ncbi:MAG: phospholipid carrier-dependent glycosyltransferase [Acidobacteria bacterium]|nr:phospholipid carrier-dependent glycosyltransferase [Acidobacteriota bacterium]